MTFLDRPDGRLTVSHELCRDIYRVIWRVRPQRVVCPSPVRNFRRIHASHPDHHLAAGEATLSAVYPDARNPFAHPEAAARRGAGGVGGAGGVARRRPLPDQYVDVTETYEAKVAALGAHGSQMAGVEDLDRLLTGWLGEQVRAAGRLTEVFQVVDTS